MSCNDCTDITMEIMMPVHFIVTGYIDCSESLSTYVPSGRSSYTRALIQLPLQLLDLLPIGDVPSLHDFLHNPDLPA